MILEYTAKRRKNYNFNKYSLPIVFCFWINMYDRNLSIEDADKEQNDLDNKLIGIKEVKYQLKRSFLNNTRLFSSAREKILNNFKSKIFQIKNLNKIATLDSAPEPIKAQTKKS